MKIISLFLIRNLQIKATFKSIKWNSIAKLLILNTQFSDQMNRSSMKNKLLLKKVIKLHLSKSVRNLLILQIFSCYLGALTVL